MNRKQAILFVFLLFFIIPKGKPQVNFSIEIKNYADSAVLLTSYYGSKIKLVDTAYLNEGMFHFKEKKYPAGIYILADLSKNKLFEFIINNETGFHINVESLSEGNIIVYDSRENELFFELLQIKRTVIEEMSQNLVNKSFEDSSNLALASTQQIDSLQNLMRDKELEIIQDNDQLFISKLLFAQREIEIPHSIIKDTMQKYLYQKKHFWDRLDLSDERFLRTPLLEPMLNTYFNHFVYKHPDSAITAIDTVIAKARPSVQMASYLLWYFISEYQNPKYMGFDKVFVHLVDNYFLKEEIAGVTPSILEKLNERSAILKPLLIGEPAPNLMLIDTNEKYESFYNLETDFTLLLFWDYTCDVCETEINELLSILDTTSYIIGVYAINTNGDTKKWKEVIQERKMNWLNVNGSKGVTQDYHDLYDINGTPRLFLLDNEKKIIAKHFKVAQLIAIIENQFMKGKFY